MKKIKYVKKRKIKNVVMSRCSITHNRNVTNHGMVNGVNVIKTRYIRDILMIFSLQLDMKMVLN